MKTLLLNGSPHPSGDTAALVAHLFSRFPETHRIHQIDAYTARIAPCCDCRYCWKADGCCIRDPMNRLIDELDSFDNILIASPVYFSTLTPPLLSVASRLQLIYTSRRFRGKKLITRRKKGGVILTGGGEGSLSPAWETARSMLRVMGAKEIFPLVSSHHTDSFPAREDTEALKQAEKLAEFFLD